MKKNVFSVKFTAVRNCFLYFSENWLRKFNSSNRLFDTLVVEYGASQKAYFSWSAEASPIHDDSVVCLSSVYARTLGIEEGETVIISLHSQAQSVSRIHVLPLSSDDWQILMLKSSDVQSSLLDQLQVVWPGQVLVIWLSKSFHLRVVVETIHPSYDVGILQPLTEVVVSSPETVTGSGSATTPHKSVSGDPGVVTSTHSGAADEGLVARLWSGLTRWLPLTPQPSDVKSRDGCETGSVSRSHEDKINKLLTCDSTKKLSNWVVRVHPLQNESLETSYGALSDHPYNIYVSKERLVALDVDIPLDRNIIICKISKILFPKPAADKVSFSSEDVKVKDAVPSVVGHPHIFVRLCFAEEQSCVLQSQLTSHPRHEHALFTHTAMAALQVAVGAKARVELISAQQLPSPLKELHITPRQVWDADLGSIDSLFTRHLAAVTGKSSLLLNSGATLPVRVTSADVVDFRVKLVPSSVEYTVVDAQSLVHWKVCVDDASTNDGDEANADVQEDIAVAGKFFGSLDAVLEEGTRTLQFGLQIHQAADKLRYTNTALSAVNILIVGKLGSGKSTVSKAMCHLLGKSPHFVHSVHIQCRYLKGKKVETLQRLMVQWLVECAYYQPSVLVLDDLEAIVGAASSPEDATSAEGLYYSRVGERLVDTLQEFQSGNDICVVATTSSVKKLDHSVMAPRGRHVFHAVLEIQELTKADRLMSLEYILRQTTCTDGNLPSVDLEGVANHTEGYVIQDLVDLVDKATFEMWRRAVLDDNCPSLMAMDFEEGRRNMIPLSLRGISLFRDSGVTWDDVGGLGDVKQRLEQIIMWPSQYPELFAQCPLRHQSGVLLYGAPGTGKTHLAGALAHHCGLNFISVKGPELLSKYIGASEEAVRNIFQKRGHDSTGVTDRVVNQLLTQLDGVESLHGVWVVGATSRPDLLDPALLRPGRLDHAVLCPLPHEDDRVSILKALSCSLILADNVDLEEIASCTDGFTGADLQALLYTAQLSATNVAKSNLPDVLPACSEIELSSKPEEDDNVCEGRRAVTQEHLLASLRDTRPSLSPQEKIKYELIYQKFSNSMVGNTAEETVMLTQKATLA